MKRWTRRPEGSTWGDWGEDDQLGRLNLLTPQKILQGIAEVKEGRTFCLSLPLDLPRSDAAGASQAPASVALAIDRDGRLYIGDQPIEPVQLVERVREAARRDPTTEVQLRADRNVPYGRVAELIGWVQQAGLTRIGFVTEAPR